MDDRRPLVVWGPRPCAQPVILPRAYYIYYYNDSIQVIRPGPRSTISCLKEDAGLH